MASKGMIDSKGWGNLWDWGQNAVNWLGDQVEDATDAIGDVLESVTDGDIMGALADAQAIAAEAAERAEEAWVYSADELLGPDDI